MKIKKIMIFSLLLFTVVTLSACGKKTSEEQNAEIEAPVVEVQSVSNSRNLEQESIYPAIVSAGMEARLSAQMPGVVTGADFQVGDIVSAGQVLARVNEIGSNTSSFSGANSNQIRQAAIATQQAQAAYELARSNYENILISSTKDLEQANIARQQASSSLNNLGSTSGENIKSAQLAYESAQLAAEQARLSLVNREKQLDQSSKNIEANAKLAASAAFNIAGSVLTGINNITGLDDNNVVYINYRNNLGALDSSSYNRADLAYQVAKASYDDYLKQDANDTKDSLNQALNMLNKFKSLADATKYLFDKSIPSASLPQSSAVGVSLSSLQSAAASYQSQLNSALSQAQSASQALTNFDLENESVLDSLNQAYALTKKQEASAAQNLSSLKAGNKSQSDQASFSVSLADNQYENLKIKINSQILAAKTQMDSANLQYNNAAVALQGLYDTRSIVSPIDAKVFQKLVSNGDTVSAGQLMAVVGQSDGIKLKFFVEPENVAFISLEQEVRATDSDGKEYIGKISSVSAQADMISKRFQVEASLVNLENPPLLGTVVNVHLSLSKDSVLDNGSIFLPLSAIEIGQNGNFISLVEDNKVKKMAVEIDSVLGETAKVRLDAPGEALIIINGNKLLNEGDTVKIKQ